MNKETRNIAINEMKHNLKTSWFPYLEEEISDRGVKWWCVGAPFKSWNKITNADSFNSLNLLIKIQEMAQLKYKI